MLWRIHEKKPHPQTNQLTKERDSDHTMGEEIHDEANVFERMVLEQRPEGEQKETHRPQKQTYCYQRKKTGGVN